MMKRVWKLSDTKCFTKTFKTLTINTTTTTTPAVAAATTTKIKTSPNFSNYTTQSFAPELNTTSQTQCTWSRIVNLFTDKLSNMDGKARRDLTDEVSVLRSELVAQREDDLVEIEKVLDNKGVILFRKYSDGSAVVELLTQLEAHPSFFFEVLNWRRRQVDYRAPLCEEEYAKGIVQAGRMKDVDLAVELFKEARRRQLNSTSIYNALMSAYLINGQPFKCQSLFQELKGEATCTPTIVTYNIIISMFGGLMMTDQMEATFREILGMNISPNVRTFNNLLSGYLTAWKWDEMEKMYGAMQTSDVEPDLNTHLLMLRAYAHSGQLGKMEKLYEIVKAHVNQNEIPLIRTMIWAYCRSSDVNRIRKINELLKVIPEDNYKPGLNVILILLYAREDMLEQMENSIKEAFEHGTYIHKVSILRCIIASYYRQNEVDRLANFVERAESAGWMKCRSLYHCKMVMYSAQRRLTEMERVLEEMARMNIYYSKKTFWILYKAYSKWEDKNKLAQVIGKMCRHGYGIPLDGCSS